jgi:tetratricopeptide (TPR) repeat protein
MPSNMKGLSVHYLVQVLLDEVKDSGLDVNTAKVYDLEPDLKSNSHGFIRRKGAKLTCLQDGKLGRAYVDCIRGEDLVGPANVMLSYTWDYSIKDIVTTLHDQCIAEGRDPKRTYVWICCFCNNQHRISEGEVPFEEFRKTFYGTVTGVGTVWSMMSPWNKPKYLTRVWCIFELYVANDDDGVTSNIIMPQMEKENMIEALGDIDNLFNALSNTRIENAEASLPEDKKNILALIEGTVGYTEFNITVNVLIRDWISSVLFSVVEADKGGSLNASDAADYAIKLFDIARALEKMDFPDDALKIYQRCLTIREKSLGKDHPDTATTYNNIGFVLKSKGEYEDALKMYNKCLTIQEKSLGKDHPYTATTYSNIGLVLDTKGEYDEALEMYNKCLTIQEKSLGKDHPSTANTYNNIGKVLDNKGEYEDALKMYNKCLTIEEKSLGKDHPTTATTYNNIGLVLKSKGEYDEALKMYNKCLTIREKSLGKDHPDTAATYRNIGLVVKSKGE